MPFITEEIWNHLPKRENMLIVEEWPGYDQGFIFEKAEKDLNYIMNSIKAIRNARQEMNIAPSRKATIYFVTRDKEIEDILKNGKGYFLNLASADEIVVGENKDGVDEDNISVVLDRAEVFIPLKDLIDFEKEIERLEKEKEKLEGELKRVKGKLSNKGFVDKAPEKVVQEEKDKEIKYQEMMDRVLERLNSLKENI